MNCPDVQPLLHAYTDQELDLVHCLDVERHLQTCGACAAENRALLSLRSVLRAGNFTYRAPESLREKVRQITRDPEGAREPARTVRPVRIPWLWQWLAAGATALAILTLMLRPGGVSNHDVLANEIISSHVRSLMAGHLTDVVSSDQHTVKPWFNGKLDFSPDVKDFAAQGFPLVGGRLDYLNGRAVSALIYRRNQHFINVFIWPAAAAGNSGSGTKNLRGFNLISRDADGLHYALVSDLNASELGELAELIGK